MKKINSLSVEPAQGWSGTWPRREGTAQWDKLPQKPSQGHRGGSSGKRRTGYKCFLSTELSDLTSLKVLDNVARAGWGGYFLGPNAAPRISHHVDKLKVCIFPQTSMIYIKRMAQTVQPGTYRNHDLLIPPLTQSCVVPMGDKSITSIPGPSHKR